MEVVDEFPYHGSVIFGSRSLDEEVSSRLSKAFRVFGRQLNPIFLCPSLSTTTKPIIYRAVVLSSPLYGSETWAVKTCHICRLKIVHHSCVLRISRIGGRLAARHTQRARDVKFIQITRNITALELLVHSSVIT